MITILYPKDDFDAANVAVKVQALAQSRNQKIYVVPKHYGRNRTEVQESLKKSSIALLIAQAANEIDQDTLDELKALIDYKKKVIGFIPDELSLTKSMENSITLEKYHKGDSNELRSGIINYLARVQKNQDASGILVVLGLILFLFLLAFNTDD